MYWGAPARPTPVRLVIDSRQCFAGTSAQTAGMPLEGSSAQFYRNEAERIRRLAEETSLPDLKQQLLMIADQFDRLAKQYELGLRR